MKSLNRVLMAALCTSAMTVPAYAQDTGAEEFDDNVIIVTATRRAQDVQDIPLAVTAVSPVQLEQQGVVNVQNIGSVSPSFSTSNAQIASGSVVLRIRGVGTTSNNIGFESAVGIFVDGVYQSRPGVALSEFVDVERVEVLRGPQGTLFGRNTSAGALNITNKRPDVSEFGGFVNASYGNYDLISVQGAVNAPIVEDTLAVRLTGAYRQRDGYIDVVDGAGNDIGDTNDIDQYLIRGQIGYEGDSGLTVRLIGDYSKSTSSCCGAVELLASPLAIGGMAAPNVATTPFDQTAAEQALDDRISTQSFLPEADVDQWGISAEVEFPLGDNADVIYIGSYRDFESVESYDSDFSGLSVFDVDRLNTEITTMTHELRFQGELFDGRLNWLVGAYYSDEEIRQQTDFSLGADYDALVGAIFGGAVGPAPLTLFSGVSPATVTATNAYAQDSESFSFFTHNTLEITDSLDFTVGLRYSDESKTGSFSQPASNNGVCPAIVSNLGGVTPAGAAPIPPASPATAALRGGLFGLGCFAFVAPADLPGSATAPGNGLPLPRTYSEDFSDSELIYTIKASYEFADPINIYASFTHGYKSGGFNLDSTAAVNGADPSFLSEEVDAYEIGLKSKFLDNAITLNVAAFYQEFSNFQVLEFTGAQFQTFNVPKAETQGVEIEAVIRPDDYLTVNAGVTYTDANYPSDCAGTQTSNNVLSLCGNSLTNAPQIVAITGATYERDLGDSLDFFLNGQVRFESDRRTSTQAFDPSDLTTRTPVPFDVQDGNVKINLRAGIGSQDDSWGIEAWVQNLTNETTRGVTFNTVLRGGSRSAFPQEPRTFGLTLRGAF